MLRVDLGPVTVVRETTKGQVRHRLREQQKVPGSLLEGSVPLTWHFLFFGKRCRTCHFVVSRTSVTSLSFYFLLFYTYVSHCVILLCITYITTSLFTLTHSLRRRTTVRNVSLKILLTTM